MNHMHRAIALRRSRPVGRSVSALAEPRARASCALGSRPARPALSTVAKASGESPGQATRGFRNHRAKAFQAQLASALARRRRQVLVSQWALPLSEDWRGLSGTVSSGSGVGGVQAALRFFTGGDAQPFVQADGFAAA